MNEDRNHRWWTRRAPEPPIDHILKDKKCVEFLMEDDNLFEWLEVIALLKEHNMMVDNADKNLDAKLST